MKLDQYKQAIRRTDYTDQELVERFIPRLMDPLNAKLIHYSLGLAGEAGEIVDAVKKTLRDGKPLDRVNLIEEAGDILWYLTNLLTALDSTLEDAAAANIAKLDKRYPQGFTEAGGINRDTQAERRILERKTQRSMTDSTLSNLTKENE